MFESENTSLTHFWKWQRLVVNYLKWIATWHLQKIVLNFFKEHMMVYLDFAFVNNQAFGLNKCKQIMESKFLMEINKIWTTKILQGFWNGLNARF